MITVREIQEILEAWAPRQIQWERDNSGLQCGSPRMVVRGILVTLDATEQVIAEARRRNLNLIVSHHPLLFRALQSVDTQERSGRILAALLRHEMSLYAVHTNADFTSGGTSHALALLLGLRNPVVLELPYRVQKKVVTFVPASHVEKITRSMALEGAGIIGNYDHCSFRVSGSGTFRGNTSSNPAVGEAGKLERVEEIRLEMVVPQPRLDRVLHALRTAHPYEEVAVDVYPMENTSTEFGSGAIGDLPRPRSLASFLKHVKRTLATPRVRVCGDLESEVRTVAVCGGSGGDLLERAIQKGADVFVTSDVRYHTFLDCDGRIALIDAGHYETERPIVRTMADLLKKAIARRGERIPVLTGRVSTNPIQYV